QARLAETPSAASGFASRQYQLYVTASWAADIWGKLTSAKKAALAQLPASEAFRRAVQSRLVADVAASYYSLLALDQQLLIAKNTVASRQVSEKTIRLLKDAGVVTGADVEQSRANVFSAQILIPDLELQIREI